MTGPFQMIEQAVQQAKIQMAAVDSEVSAMVRLSADRLRKTDGNWKTVEALKALKRELQGFDMRTGQWKD